MTGQPVVLINQTDVTERVAAERALSEKTEALQRSNHNLKTAQHRLVMAQKMAALGQLVAGVAHEINTPIGVALTSASYLAGETSALAERTVAGRLKKSDLDRFIAEAGDATRLLLNNLARAGALIQAFRELADDHQPNDRVAFDLAPFLSRLTAFWQTMSLGGGHRLEVTCPPGLVLLSHPDALSRVLTQLVTNSVRHAYPEGQSGRIMLSVAGEDDKPDWIALTYTDDGIGIAPELAAKVFEPFFTTRRGGGCLGLGLHIAYNLMTGRLGGQIELIPDPNGHRGARFRLGFPRQAPTGGGDSL
jgi:signal transduction histidine kinase